MSTLRAALLATALLAPAAAASDALARPMTPQDVARLEYAGAIAVSRDGSGIAYTTVSRPDVTVGEENGSASQQLYFADAPMSARAYLPGDVSASSIAFSPDGNMVTYLWAKGEEDRALWGVPVAGGAPRKLAAVEDANVLGYEMSPDGSEIFLLAAAAPMQERDDEAEAGFDAVVYEEEFQFNRVFAADYMADGVDEDLREIAVDGYVDHLDVSPDGEFMVLTAAPTPLIDDSYTSKRAYIYDTETGERMLEIETPGKIGDIEIAPDGMQLSMIAAVDENDPAATTLHLVDVATGEYTALNEGAPEAAIDTEWMADGRLAAVIHVGAQSVLRFYGAQGDMQREVDPGELILTGIDQGGNRLAATAHSPQFPPELFLYSGGGFERWTAHNEWLADIDFGPQRTVTYTARDGQEVEGILIEPVGGIPFERAPTIMDVHGGPEAHESNGWVTSYSNPGQVAAGQGYAVFLPNYRGSTAYGTAFSKQHSGNYTDPEFTDIVDAKNALAEMGITDPERTGITGGSYGGYATAWSSTALSEEYAAGVMFVGISNQISKFGTTDIPNEMRLVHSLEWPWEDWQGMLEESPIYHAGNADTPLLIMHGDADPRVSPTQSYEMYRNISIRRPDTPVRLVLYPGEGHGNRMAAARYDYNLRMMEWFDTYLMTGDRDAEMPAPRPDLMIEEDGAE